MNKMQVRWGVSLVSFSLVLLLGISAVLSPEGTKSVMDALFNFTVFKLGFVFLWYALIGTAILAIIAFSKYGNIQLGGDKPQFSKFQLFAMALSAGMGASTMYWGFIECIYYYTDPQFGLVDNAMMMEYASAYNLFHWGPVGWVLYLMCAVPFMIVFYVKKQRNMSLSGVINALFDNRLPLFAQKVIDLMFILTTLAATALTLGLAIPMISANVSNLTGIPNSLMLGINIIIGLSIVFSLSSYIGIEKGMAKISNATIYVAIGMLGLVLIVGPSTLLVNNTTNAIGIMVHDYLRMSTNMDPFGTTGFPQYWTIFFFANWISYAPGMGVFVTKIAKGHKLRDVLLLLIGAGSLGTAIIFGIFGTFTLDLMNRGVVDAVGYINAGQPAELLHAVFMQTPFPAVMMGIYLVTMVLFTVTTLDGSSFSLASVASVKVGDDGNVSPMFRLFWCLLLAVIPIVFLLIKADLNIFKSFPVLMVLPMMPIFLVTLLKSYKFIVNKYKDMTAKEIQEASLKIGTESNN